MKRMHYPNYATTCEQLYKFVRHLYKAHRPIPAKITINRIISQPSKYQVADFQTAYAERR